MAAYLARVRTEEAVERSKPKPPAGLKKEFLRILESLSHGPWYVETAEIVAARKMKEAEQLTEYLDKVAGIPRKFLDVDLERIGPDIPAGYHRMAGRLIDMDRRPCTLVLSGPVGLGKTALAAGLCRYFKTRGRSCRYRTAFGLLASITEAAFEKKNKVRAGYDMADLLVIDELGDPRSHQVGKEAEIIELIDRRYGAQRATLLLTNLDAKGLWELYGQKPQRRVVEPPDGGGFHPANWGRIAPLIAGRQGEDDRA